MAMSQGRPAATRSWNWQGTDSPLEPQEGVQARLYLDFGPVMLNLYFWPSGLCENKFLLSYQICAIILQQQPKEIKIGRWIVG